MRILRWALIGVVVLLASCGGGSSSTTSEASSTTSEAQPTSTVADPAVAYKVGDTGPGGGIIVYVDEGGFDNSSGDDYSIGAVCLIVSCNYLEIAPADVEGKFSVFDRFDAAENYATASANDWVLPSKDALNEMCKYAFGDTVNEICNENGDGPFENNVGGFLGDMYWSSSEYNDGDPWAQNFNHGYQNDYLKHNSFYVRPVRAF
jgi:hypothetical protein